MRVMICITREPIDPGEFCAAMAGEEGGIVTFFGTVRGHSGDGRVVERLSYEAYEPMAVAEFERIAAEARERFGARTIAIVHRVGDAGVGEVTVAVGVCADHRDAAFAACRYAIDELKRRAPIWKLERYAAGGAEWMANPVG
jgi:molybdopterin synthase catalytic subunit